ncbi:MAG: YqaA family protein [Bryobacteraceae bacterium]
MISWGPYGLLLLATLDSAGVPVVAGVDALLIAIATRDPDQAYVAAACAVIGSLAGSLFLFGVARKGGEVLLSKHIARRRGARLHAWFQRYGLLTVFLPALSPLPMPMKVPVFCAGALQVRWSYFIFVVLLARIVRYFALAYLGKHYGQQTFQFLLSHLSIVIAIAVALALLSVFVLQFIERHGHLEPTALDNASADR